MITTARRSPGASAEAATDRGHSRTAIERPVPYDRPDLPGRFPDETELRAPSAASMIVDDT
jgi:hypothetical protein